MAVSKIMNFWDHHGVFFLLGMLFFPRITGIFFSFFTPGPIFWIFYFFCPRILTAIVACHYYWATNPLLCILAILLVVIEEDLDVEGVIINAIISD